MKLILLASIFITTSSYAFLPSFFKNMKEAPYVMNDKKCDFLPASQGKEKKVYLNVRNDGQEVCLVPVKVDSGGKFISDLSNIDWDQYYEPMFSKAERYETLWKELSKLSEEIYSLKSSLDNPYNRYNYYGILSQYNLAVQTFQLGLPDLFKSFQEMKTALDDFGISTPLKNHHRGRVYTYYNVKKETKKIIVLLPVVDLNETLEESLNTYATTPKYKVKTVGEVMKAFENFSLMTDRMTQMSTQLEVITGQMSKMSESMESMTTSVENMSGGVFQIIKNLESMAKDVRSLSGSVQGIGGQMSKPFMGMLPGSGMMGMMESFMPF